MGKRSQLKSECSIVLNGEFSLYREEDKNQSDDLSLIAITLGMPEQLPETGTSFPLLTNQRPRKCDMTFVLKSTYIPSSRWLVAEP